MAFFFMLPVKEAPVIVFFFFSPPSIFSACQKDFQFACSRTKRKGGKKRRKRLFISGNGCKVGRGHLVLRLEDSSRSVVSLQVNNMIGVWQVKESTCIKPCKCCSLFSVNPKMYSAPFHIPQRRVIIKHTAEAFDEQQKFPLYFFSRPRTKKKKKPARVAAAEKERGARVFVGDPSVVVNN